MKVQNKKNFKLQGWNPKKKKFTGGKTGNDLYYRGAKHY